MFVMQSLNNTPLRAEASSSVPQIYGHRGARGEMPENSIEGFKHLLKTGVCAVELDVQNTSDGITVVWHDHNLEPDMVRDVSGDWLSSDGTLITETPYNTLVQFDIGALREGSEHAKKFPEQARLNGAHIVALEEVCRLVQSVPELVLNIEIKSYADRTDLGDSPAVLAKSVLTLVQKFSLTTQTIVSSFDWRVLSEIRKIAPDLKRGYLSYLDRDNPPMQPNIVDGSAWMDGLLLDDHEGSLPQAIANIGGTVWAPYFEDLTLVDLRRAQKLGLIVNVWTVNDPNDMQRMVDLGVDGIITDYPTKAKALFDSKELMNNVHEDSLLVSERGMRD